MISRRFFIWAHEQCASINNNRVARHIGGAVKAKEAAKFHQMLTKLFRNKVSFGRDGSTIHGTDKGFNIFMVVSLPFGGIKAYNMRSPQQLTLRATRRVA
ncbi:hypothetical protein [Massilia pseudoviolaceinigra]|uniref:hypothetical protein n=1 Tax=Massilia pseudoviolaceinigra TaxID=3057165 RepID=UPI00279668EE|nr:hypothetical protein [Massilia sp. CCM 9206]MDQ1922185.1 hypothetical protein [Massilia sp. CCM 9206]